MVKHEFEFKRRGETSNIKIEIDNGVMSLPATSFTNLSNTSSAIVRMIQTMLDENWTNIEIKEL